MTARFIALLLVLLALLAAGVAWLNQRGEPAIAPGAVPADGTPAQIARGAYLARAGNCAACHTERGGAPYAGGRGIATPFGTVYASNLTPDPATGLGRWSADHFWRALHHGRSADGRLLYPAFPYPDYTRVTREDSDALYAFLRSLPPVAQANRPHALEFPYRTQAALAVWRALFFRAGVFEPDPARSPVWNRGAYLVRGLGHCGACHGGRNVLGATPDGGQSLAGGVIPMRQWYAPALTSPAQAGVADWPEDEVVALLRDGVAPRGSVLGPMAEVVLGSTQHLDEADLRAIASFLKSLPQAAASRAAPRPADPQVLALGESTYADHCAGCHGAQGEGGRSADGRLLYPALQGSRMVAMDPPVNLVRVIVHGGYLPATRGNPRPFGMPPFGLLLDDARIAALATWLRQREGAAPVAPQEVARLRGAAAVD
ncbi:cytochrome c [Piscinibacter defluvii]|uniref:cytochrome c n=1 Tax=Piscinibacter defluvii TaxID=1796922 RepID=UPI000FDDD5D7|nr:cytochrome c [Piscinibacter defluvii]